MAEQKRRPGQLPRWPLVVVVAAGLLLWLGAAAVSFAAFDTWADRALFGTWFGGVNALFSGIAFAGVVYALVLQRREMGHLMDSVEAQRGSERIARQSTHLAALKMIFDAESAQFYDGGSTGPGKGDNNRRMKELRSKIADISRELEAEIEDDRRARADRG